MKLSLHPKNPSGQKQNNKINKFNIKACKRVNKILIIFKMIKAYYDYEFRLNNEKNI